MSRPRTFWTELVPRTSRVFHVRASRRRLHHALRGIVNSLGRPRVARSWQGVQSVDAPPSRRCASRRCVQIVNSSAASCGIFPFQNELRGTRHFRLPRRRRSSADLEIPVTPRTVESVAFLIDSASITTVLVMPFPDARRAAAAMCSPSMTGADRHGGEAAINVSLQHTGSTAHQGWSPIASPRMLRTQHAVVMPSSFSQSEIHRP